MYSLCLLVPFFGVEAERKARRTGSGRLSMRTESRLLNVRWPAALICVFEIYRDPSNSYVDKHRQQAGGTRRGQRRGSTGRSWTLIARPTIAQRPRPLLVELHPAGTERRSSSLEALSAALLFERGMAPLARTAGCRHERPVVPDAGLGRRTPAKFRITAWSACHAGHAIRRV